MYFIGTINISNCYYKTQIIFIYYIYTLFYNKIITPFSNLCKYLVEKNGLFSLNFPFSNILVKVRFVGTFLFFYLQYFVMLYKKAKGATIYDKIRICACLSA